MRFSASEKQELSETIEKFVHRFDNERHQESLQNITPADVYYGRGDLILNKRNRIKVESIKM